MKLIEIQIDQSLNTCVGVSFEGRWEGPVRCRLARVLTLPNDTKNVFTMALCLAEWPASAACDVCTSGQEKKSIV